MTATFSALQAAEALATPKGKTHTDNASRRRLLGEDLDDFFYKKDPVIRDSRRNALAHGRLTSTEDLATRTNELNMLLIAVVRGAGNESPETSVTPMRGFVTFETVGLFLEPKGDLPGIRELTVAAHDGLINSHSDPSWVGTAKERLLRRTW